MKIRINVFLTTLFSAIFISMIPFYKVKAITIVKDHQAKATIVLSTSPGRQIQNAAKILQDYIRQSTGAELPINTNPQKNFISIHIGLTSYVKNLNIDLTNLNDDGFILQKINDANYIIIGGSDYGTEFGVYSFLERFVGVSWLMPSDIGIDIPKKSDISLPDGKITESPVFLSRQLSPINIEAKNDLGNWGRFNRLKAGIQFHHNMKKLFDPADYASSNPLFYPLINGNRVIPVKGATGKTWEPNFSAPGIADSAANKIIRYFQTHPKEKSYSLGVNDGGKYDESEASKKRRSGKLNSLGIEDVSDDYFQFVNEVAAKVNKVYPDKIFGLLAYTNVADPPSEKIGVNPNVIPFLTYDRMRWGNEQLKIQGHDLTKKWSKFSSTLGWYDYDYGYSYLMPRVWFHTMQEYLTWGAKNNVKYYYAELYPNWGEGPKPWIIAKLLWNPDQNVDELLNEWYVKAAGEKAAPKLKEYYSIWETFWTSDIYKLDKKKNAGYFTQTDYSYLKIIPQSYITRSDDLMNEAYNLAETPERKLRVSKLRDMWGLYKTAYIAYNNPNNLRGSKISDPLSSSIELKNKLEALKKDPLFSNTVDYINQRMTQYSRQFKRAMKSLKLKNENF